MTVHLAAAPDQPMPDRCLLVGDDPLVREGLALALSHGFARTAVTEVEGAATAQRLFDAGGAYDLIVLDVARREASAPGELGALHARAPGTPIVVLTADTSTAAVASLLAAGARGVVATGAAVETLLDAVRAVLGGEVSVPPALLTSAPARSPGTRAGPRAGPA